MRKQDPLKDFQDCALPYILIIIFILAIYILHLSNKGNYLHIWSDSFPDAVARVGSDINIFHYPDNGYIRIFGNLTIQLTG